MKKIIFIFISFMLMVSITLAQARTSNSKDIPSRFENYYNAGQFDSIYYMFPIRPYQIFRWTNKGMQTDYSPIKGDGIKDNKK